MKTLALPMPLILFVVLQIGIIQTASAISVEAYDLVVSETQFDDAYFLSTHMSPQDKEPIDLEHFEIPLRLLKRDFVEDRAKDFMKSLIFKKNGEFYVRWVIHPEDTRFHVRIAQWLEANKVPAKKKKYFTGYKTASRSLIVVDEKTGFEFSLKTSTDTLYSLPIPKVQQWDESQQNRMINDFVLEQFKDRPPKNFVLLDEPLAIGIPGDGKRGIGGYGLGIMVRSYATLTNSRRRYVPGFAVMNQKLGAKIAKQNGSDNPAEFWNEHYNKPLARTLAELFARTGILPIAANSQNFLVELDWKNRPTGRIIVRDIGDSKIIRQFFKSIGREDILTAWDEERILRERAQVVVGILGNTAVPEWLERTGHNPGDTRFYETWGVEFFEEFDKEFKRQTGISLNRFEPLERKTDLFKIDYILTDGPAKRFFRQILKGPNYCADLF